MSRKKILLQGWQIQFCTFFTVRRPYVDRTTQNTKKTILTYHWLYKWFYTKKNQNNISNLNKFDIFYFLNILHQNIQNLFISYCISISKSYLQKFWYRSHRFKEISFTPTTLSIMKNLQNLKTLILLFPNLRTNRLTPSYLITQNGISDNLVSYSFFKIQRITIFL